MNIVISGTAGVGKTTISKELSKLFELKNKNVDLVFELDRPNPFLDLYYENQFS